jgi:hypothetical protein
VEENGLFGVLLNALIPVVINQNPNICIKKNHGYIMVLYLFIYLYFCDVAKLAIIHTKIWPNLEETRYERNYFMECFYKLGYLHECDAKSGNFIIFLKSGELISAIFSTKIHCMCQNYNLKENSKHLPPKKTLELTYLREPPGIIFHIPDNRMTPT